MHETAAALMAPRWSGQPGRLEVWYATLTDPATGCGGWLHHEVVAPEGGGDAHGLGWVALFPVDEAPVITRFGPAPVGGSARPDSVDVWFDAAGAHVAPGLLRGGADGVSWELKWHDDSPPLFTFPRWAWERDLLPAAQVVPSPAATFDGVIEAGGRTLSVAGGRGAVARIYGHGNAERWAWLHADLGGGDVLEIVTAVSRRPGLNKLPPMAFVQLRVDGVDWPRDALAAAPLFRTRLGLPAWSVRGTVGRRRLRVDVTIPPEAAIAVAYADPDGTPATCTNSERAHARITFERRAKAWETERAWDLAGTAHAEVGTRP